MVRNFMMFIRRRSNTTPGVSFKTQLRGRNQGELGSPLSAGRSGFPQENSQEQCDDDSVKQRFETSLVVRQRQTHVACEQL
jgi:hypothetical protein